VERRTCEGFSRSRSCETPGIFKKRRSDSMGTLSTHPDRLLAELANTFDLTVDKAPGDHTFDIHTRYVHYSPTGVRLSSEDLTLRIRCGATTSP
jgi:hypothetical protein